MSSTLHHLRSSEDICFILVFSSGLVLLSTSDKQDQDRQLVSPLNARPGIWVLWLRWTSCSNGQVIMVCLCCSVIRSEPPDGQSGFTLLHGRSQVLSLAPAALMKHPNVLSNQLPAHYLEAYLLTLKYSRKYLPKQASKFNGSGSRWWWLSLTS